VWCVWPFYPSVTKSISSSFLFGRCPFRLVRRTNLSFNVDSKGYPPRLYSAQVMLQMHVRVDSFIVNQTNGTPKLLPGPAFHVGLHVSNAPSSTNVGNALSNAGYPPTAKHKFHVLRCQQLLRASPKAPQKSPLNLFFWEKHKNMSPTVPLKRLQLFHSP
jgi:hypothetical protein